MRRFLYSILACSGLCAALVSCSNGDYTANPDNPANNGVNPLKPLTKSEFTWANSGKFSGDINGTHFSADTVTWYLDSTGTNVFAGYNTERTKGFLFFLNNVYSGNLYQLTYHVVPTQAIWADTVGSSKDYYASYLGNSGEVYITENDSACIKGLFYFQGVTTDGRLVTVSNGSFNIDKPQFP